jgi:hypothetical protein
MESDKPGWNDAMNGLPGVFGSAICGSIELKRLLTILLESFKSLPGRDTLVVKTAAEIVDFFEDLFTITLKHKGSAFLLWDKTHSLKEEYRARTTYGLSGREKTISLGDIEQAFKLFVKIVDKGIKKAIDRKTGLIRTYFYYESTEYSVRKKNGKSQCSRNNLPLVRVKKFRRHTLPFFLQGFVHFMRSMQDREKARILHKKVLASSIFDKKLRMFKLNESLKSESRDIGRAKIFTPGWLENESIWTHMEYKYLLELLRNGLSREFYNAIKDTLAPFLDPEVYGRSIFENTSFIVSSAHPDKALHGQGFVGRLTGATAEMISIFMAMTSGLRPFSLVDNKLHLKFTPQLASWMFTRKDEVALDYRSTGVDKIRVPRNSFLFKFLGKINVFYHNPARKNTFGSDAAEIKSIQLQYSSGKKVVLEGNCVPAPYAEHVRAGKVCRIDITLN